VKNMAFRKINIIDIIIILMVVLIAVSGYMFFFRDSSKQVLDTGKVVYLHDNCCLFFSQNGSCCISDCLCGYNVHRYQIFK
jgi:flagellar basal body-associated protein FliL